MRAPTIIPLASLLVLVLTWGSHPHGLAAVALFAVLATAVIGSVHHAEVLAHRLGEPFGTLLLAISVTIIEVGLIIALTVGSDTNYSLARDTVFAAFMIACNGIVGASLLAATLRGRTVTARFHASGSGAMLATLTAIGTISLVLPNFTDSTSGPTFTAGQLVFAATSSIFLYALFVYVQTIRHREQFQPVPKSAQLKAQVAATKPVEHPEHTGSAETGVFDLPDHRPTSRQAWLSLGYLLASLTAVVGLAKTISTALEEQVLKAGLPLTTVGVIIGLLILSPEGITAIRAARHGHGDVQRSFNLAYGSAMASIGLTIPVIAIVSIVFDLHLLLGLRPADMALMALTIVVSVLTVTPGRATLLQGGVHLTIFACWLALAVMP